MRTVRRATALLAAALLGATLLGTPTTHAAAAPTVDLDPAKLDRGPDIAIPHVDGDDLVDGTRRVDLPGARAVLLGASGDAHVVGTTSANGTSNRRIIRVEADGTLTTLLTGVSPWETVLSEDGGRLVSVGYGTRRASPVTVWSARTGERLARRSFRDYPSIVAAEGRKVLLSTWDRGVFWWRLGRARTQAVTHRPAGFASIRNNLLATYTADPYSGGCTVLTTLGRPGRALWRSCRERVEGISPDGTRMATVDLLSDGIGPSRIWQRLVDGTRLATYRTEWFGAFEWETPTTMLLDTHGRRLTSMVRCDLGDCENASDPEPTVQPRTTARLTTPGP